MVGNQRLYIGGDILTAIDGQAVTGFEDLFQLLETRYKADDTVIVTLLRGEREMSVTVVLAEEPIRQ